MLSEPHFTRMKRDLKRLGKHFPGATVADLTGAQLAGYFEARQAALKTYNNRRGIVSTLLKFALQAGQFFGILPQRAVPVSTVLTLVPTRLAAMRVEPAA